MSGFGFDIGLWADDVERRDRAAEDAEERQNPFPRRVRLQAEARAIGLTPIVGPAELARLFERQTELLARDKAKGTA